MNECEIKWTHTKMTQKQTSDLARKKTKIIAFEMGPTMITSHTKCIICFASSTLLSLLTNAWLKVKVVLFH